MSIRGIGRITLVAALACSGLGCGVPSPEDARLRPPPSAARTSFDRSFAAVYAASKAILEAEQQTPEWKELQIKVDDPAAGILIAERRLAGAVPGLAVRDLWSFYVERLDENRTQVTFVIESSDRPKATVGPRSWAQGNGTIFPAMRRMLSETPTAETPPQRRAPETVAGRPAPAAPRPEPIPAVTASPAQRAANASRTTVLTRVAAALQNDPTWRATTRERSQGGERLVLVGAWAQLSAHDDAVQIAFPSYPAPPAYDVARLMRFLSDAGFTVEVLPGSAFRSL